jgi:signal transduction histidine kinase
MSGAGARFGLGFKISLLLIVAVIGGLLSLSYVFIGVSRNTTEALLKENHIGISDAISRRVQSSVDDDLRSLRYVVDVLNDKDLPDMIKVQTVTSVLRNSNEISFLAIYDETGKLLDVQKPRNSLLPFPAAETLSIDSTAINGGIDGEVFISPADSLPYTRLIVPWDHMEESGALKRVGFLMTYVSLAPLSDDVAEISHRRFGRSDLVYVVNDDGRVIAHADLSMVKRGSTLASTDLFTKTDSASIRELFHRDVGFSKEYTNLAGQLMLASFATVSRLRIGVLVEEPVHEAYASIDLMRLQLILWTCAGAATAFLVGIFFSKTITRPIRKLVTATHEIAGGDYGNTLPINSNDEVAELTSSFNTMSVDLQKSFDELRQANEHIVKAEKMALRGEIVSEVSHELKNFLQVILIHTYQLRKMPRDADPAKVADTISKIEAGLNQMHNFSENLLTRGDNALNLQPVDVNELIAGFVSFIDVLPKYKRAKITIEPGEGSCGAMLDIDQLRQVFLNLAKNAVEARADIRLLFKVERLEERHQIRIAISDDGPGIRPEVREKLFKERITTKADGHGFGLPVCQKIIEAQGGTITVESVVGEGATFIISFPLL